MTTSSSDSEDTRKLPAAYRSRKRKESSSSSTFSSRSESTKTWTESSDEGRKKRGRRRWGSRRRQKKRAKKDKPMWKEEGEISDDPSSSGDSRSRSRDRKRHARRRRSRERGDSRRLPTSSGASLRNKRRREPKTPRPKFQCKECGCKHTCLKALLHHEMNDHNLDAPCHLCHQKLPTKSKLREHYELEHTSEVVKCTFCKSSFDVPLEMDDKRWEEMVSHLYGEILYSRLAEHEERAGENVENAR